MTSSPTAGPVTPGPTRSTTPATSDPAMRLAGRRGAAIRTRIDPLRISRSAALTEEAITRTSTSPAFGFGLGTSRSSTDSGGPYLGWTIARIVG